MSYRATRSAARPMLTDLPDLVRSKPAQRTQSHFYERIGKRALDVTLVLVAALPVALLVGVLALVIALDGRSPLFVQERVGRNGRIFRMWKLRSMVADAETRLEDCLCTSPQRRLEWDEHQKLREDPRVTRIGYLIRKTSLDELPQLWNVLRGEMSLVGPRPMLPSQRALYPGTAYYVLRPGISGYWQISERNKCSFADRAEHDTRYAREMSLGTDLRVIFCTMRVVLTGTGC